MDEQTYDSGRCIDEHCEGLSITAASQMRSIIAPIFCRWTAADRVRPGKAVRSKNQRKGDQSVKTHDATEIAYKNGYAKGYEDGKMDACPKGSSPTQKIKTGFARIIVDMIADRPYFSILYLEPKDGMYHIGYSSYELQNVIAWRSEYFEIGEEEITFPYPVKHGQWAHLGGDEWCCTECGNVITTEGSWEKPKKKYCDECGADMRGKEDGKRKAAD